MDNQPKSDKSLEKLLLDIESLRSVWADRAFFLQEQARHKENFADLINNTQSKILYSNIGELFDVVKKYQ